VPVRVLELDRIVVIHRVHDDPLARERLLQKWIYDGIGSRSVVASVITAVIATIVTAVIAAVVAVIRWTGTSATAAGNRDKKSDCQ
jgi:hypothetical protein